MNSIEIEIFLLLFVRYIDASCLYAFFQRGFQFKKDVQMIL